MQTIDVILKNEITNSSDHNLVKAKRDYANFVEMCKYCETIACRHKVFSDYFQDAAPACINRCDVCKNPKETQDALNLRLNSNELFVTPIRDNDFCNGECNNVAINLKSENYVYFLFLRYF